MTKFKLATASILATASMALTVPASAHSFEEKVSKEVSYKGLDLASTEGQEKFHKRIGYAVRVVCSDFGERGLSVRVAQQQCMTDAKTNATRDAEVAIARYIDRSRHGTVVVGN